MSRDTLKFVIAGHVDHGKSTLIGRLLYDTGSLPEGKMDEIRQICESLGKDLEYSYIMDNLEEERDQGITIDTAQIFFKSDSRDYVIIDAPGHVEFLRNMITGASQADAGLLIIDANEGIREQTRRHAYLLSLLGINNVIVVINKMDLVGYSHDVFEGIKDGIITFFSGININPVHIIPISAKNGDNIISGSANMGWFDGPAVLGSLDSLMIKSDDKGPLRFIVQDVYSFEKRIVAGRVESGTMRKGDIIIVLPSGETTSIRTLEEYLKEPVEAAAGKSIGITTEDKLFIDRGCVIAHEGDVPEITESIRANVFWMDKTPLKAGEWLFFRCGTQEIPCTVEKIYKVINSSTLEIIQENAIELKNREVGEVLIRSEKPVVVDTFMKVPELGRFILARDNTCGSGIITGTVR